jgi:hypothetical protein
MIFCQFVTVLTGIHMVAARGLLQWSQETLAQKANVAIGTIRRMEAAADARVVCNTETLAKVQGALEREGIAFLNDSQPGVRLMKPADRANART